jgi:peptide/nickel transport system permease protein
VLRYIGRRCLYMVPTLFAISVVAFLIIQLPPGDYLTTYVTRLEAEGQQVDPAVLEGLRERYGLGDPLHIQYLKWISSIILHGDFGQSFEYGRSVSSLIGDRLPWSIGLTLFSLGFVWVVAFPIGVYSAVKQYSVGDYVATGIGFLGLAIPMLAAREIHAAVGGISLPNPASVAFHERFGFRKVAHFPEVGFKLGRWVDVGYWQRTF